MNRSSGSNEKNKTIQAQSDFAITKHEDITYGYGIVHSDRRRIDPETADLKLDLWCPDQAEHKKPLLIYVHGGGFKGTMKKQIRKHQLFYQLGEYYVPKGWAVASIEYRVKRDFSLYPQDNWAPSFIGKGIVRNIEFPEVHAAVRDTKASLRWFKAIGCEKYDIDYDKIILVGTSAGGCTVLAAALDDDDFNDDGVADTTAEKNYPGINIKPAGVFVIAGRDNFVKDDVFTGRNSEFKSWQMELSDYDSKDPPVAIWHGSEDKLIPVEYGIDIYNRCRNSGIKVAKYIIQGGPHVCWNCKYEEKPILYWIENFAQEFLNIY